MSRWAEIFDRLSVGNDTSDTSGHIERPSPEVSGCVPTVNTSVELPEALPTAAERAAARWTKTQRERAATIDYSSITQAWVNHDRPLTDRDIAEPLRVTDGRRMHRFRADAIVETVQPHARDLLDQARQFGAVLVADGPELHVVAPKLSQLPPELLAQLRIAAGAVIAALRGEHRARTQTGSQDPKVTPRAN